MKDNNFQVDSPKRQLQLCELEILKAVKQVCDKNGLTFYLSSGTLLGAIRHQGFIPWDDDIDIEMPYKDYLRFLDVAQDELGDGYFVQNCDTDLSFHYAFTKIRKNNTTMMSPWESGIPGHHGIWIDVFPQIYTGKGIDFKVKRILFSICNVLLMNEPAFSQGKDWLESQSSKIKVQLVIVLRMIPFGVRRKVCGYIRRAIMNGRKKPYISHVWGNITRQSPTTMFEVPPCEVLFEGELFPAVQDWDQYLRIAYGNYMTLPPESQRNGGHGDVIIDLEHGW